MLIFFYKNSDFYAFEDYINSLYILDFEIPLFNINCKKNRLDNQYPSYLWYYRLDRINETRIVKLYNEGYFDHFKYESYETCKDCVLGKLTKTPFNRKSERFKESLGLIHIDVCRPMMICAIDGYTYFIIFIDYHFRYYCVYLMKYKSKSFERFKEFRNEVEKQSKKIIKICWLDQGDEYLAKYSKIISKTMRFSYNEHFLEHHNLMELLKREIIPYCICYALWWAMQTSHLLSRATPCKLFLTF